jgi:hypothetical protein
MRALERKGFIRINELKSRGIVLTTKTKDMYGLHFVGESQTDARKALQNVVEILDGFPESIDLSTSSGTLQGADTVIRAMQKAVLEGLSVPKEVWDDRRQ